MDADACGAQTVAETPLYLSASLSGYAYRTLPGGAAVQVLYDDGAWSQVLSDGVTGYIPSARLRMTGAVMHALPDVPGAGEQYAVVTSAASTLNMRREAGMSSPVLLTIPRGETVIVSEPGKEWHRVRYHGVTGYCSAAYLSLGMAGAGQDSALTAVVDTASGPLNLRASASTQGKVLTTIPRGLTLTVLARGADWCAVSYNGRTGFVMTKYLRFPADAPAVASPAPTAAPTQAASDTLWKPVPVQSTVTFAKVTTPEGSLNLRKKASGSSTVKARIPQDEMIEVLERGDKWTKVSYHDKTGYVMTAFLTFVEVPQPVQPAAMTARVATPKGSLNLRKTASSGAKVLRTIPRDAAVIVLSYGETWSQVAYGSATGYVKSEFLAFDQPPESAAALRTARLKTASGLRDAPSADASLTAAPRAGDYVLVASVAGGWAKCEYEGITGYLPLDSLEYP